METNTGNGAPLEADVFHAEAPGSNKRKLILTAVLFVLLAFVASLTTYVISKNNAKPEHQSAIPSLSQEETVRSYTLSLIDKAKTLKSSQGSNAEIAKELNTVADERRQALLGLLHNDTPAFLRLAQPNGFADLVPAGVATKTEKTTKVSGKLTVSVGDPIQALNGKDPQAEPQYDFSVTDKTGKRSRVYFDKDVDPRYYNRNISVDAVELSGEYAVQADALTTSSTSTASTGTTTTAAATVSKRVAVVLVNFTSNTSQPYSKANIASAYFSSSGSVNSYYQEATYGQRGFTGDVYGWYTIDTTTTNCPYNDWSTAAAAKVAASGVDLSGYDYVSYVFPSTSSCYWAGMGDVNGRTTWINGYGTSLFVIGHEIGHNIGLQHAGTLTCKDAGGAPVAISDNCAWTEYADPNDIMGNSNNVRQISTFRKLFLQSEPLANMKTVTSGDYTIAPLEQATTATQTLRIPRTYDSTGKIVDYYYIDYRQPYGFDSYASTDNAVSGVMIHIGGETTQIYKTQALDMTPGSSAGFSDMALTTGNEFYDAAKNIRVVTKSVSSTGATVSVNGVAGTTCTRQAPAVSAQPSSQWGYGGSTLTYTVTVASRDSAACPASTFYLNATPPTGFTRAFSTYALQLSPGASGSFTAKITADTTVVGGSYVINVTASNGTTTVGTMTGTVPLGFNVYNQTVGPPTVSISSPADGSALSGRVQVKASAVPGGGRTITRMEVYVSNMLVSTTTGSNSVSYTINANKVKATGSVPVTVMAYDSQNAVGSATVTLVK